MVWRRHQFARHQLAYQLHYKNQYSKEINEKFLETFSKCDLQQLVDFPTRRNNILDIVATNRPNLLNKCEPIAGMSDHETMVLLDIECHAKIFKSQKRKVLVWRKVDIKQLKIKSQL